MALPGLTETTEPTMPLSGPKYARFIPVGSETSTVPDGEPANHGQWVTAVYMAHIQFSTGKRLSHVHVA